MRVNGCKIVWHPMGLACVLLGCGRIMGKGTLQKAAPSATRPADTTINRATSSYRLIAWMACAGRNPALAGEACAELYHRFAQRLLGAARKWQYLGSEFHAEASVNEAFLRAYNQARRFKRPPQPAGTQQDEQVLIWLFTILKNIILDCGRKIQSRRKETREASEKRGPALSGKQREIYSACARKFMLTLLPRDEDILLTTCAYLNFSRNGSELPDEIRQALCHRYGVSEGNLRVRRMRLLSVAKQSIEKCVIASTTASL